MPKDALAILERRRRRLPASGKALLQQLIRAGPMVPDSDRCHDAESGQPEDEPAALPGDVQIVAEFVLRDQVKLIERHLIGMHPRQDLLEGSEVVDFGDARICRCHDGRPFWLAHRLSIVHRQCIQNGGAAMFAGICTTAMFIAIAHAAMQQTENTADAAQLVIKGKDFMIHALGVPQQREKETLLRGPEEAAFSGGIILVHTETTTDKMKILARGSSGRSKGPPMGIDRYYLTENGVQDFRVDKERLYVLQYSTTYVGLGKAPLPTRGDGGSSEYWLLVFSADKGVLLHKREVTRPDKESVERTDKGPLRLRENGVEVFGTRVEFRGTELIKPAPESKK
jgi:hypothetical protein